MLLKRGTVMDAATFNSLIPLITMVQRQEPSEKPSSQIDTDAHSTKKSNYYYFGYKVHIGFDVSTIQIKKQRFTPSKRNDQIILDEFISNDGLSLCVDAAYYVSSCKEVSRKDAWFYGVRNTPQKGQMLTKK